MGTAYDKVMQNRKVLQTDLFDSIRKNQMLFPYVKLPGALTMPVNAAKNYVFKGVNAVRLLQVAMARGSCDNRFMTFEQAKEAGYYIKPGSKGVMCEHWMFDDKTPGATGMPRVSYYYVFHADDIDGIDPIAPITVEMPEEHKTIVEQEIEKADMDRENGFLVNLVTVFVKAKYGLLDGSHKDSEIHELSYLIKNANQNEQYIPALIKEAQEISDTLSLQIDEKLARVAMREDKKATPEEIFKEATYDAYDFIEEPEEEEEEYLEDEEFDLEESPLFPEEFASSPEPTETKEKEEEPEADEPEIEIPPGIVMAKDGSLTFDFPAMAVEDNPTTLTVSPEKKITEIKPTEAPKKTKKADRNKAKIEDFGAKIGGARKDLWAARGLVIEDLADMNEAEKLKYVTKDNIWKKPDYKKLIEDGLPVKAAYFIKTVRDGLATKPQVNSRLDNVQAVCEEYIAFVRDLRESVMQVKTREETLGFFKTFLEDKGYVTRGYYCYNTTKKSEHCLDNRLLKACNVTSTKWDYTYDREIKNKQFGLDADKKIAAGYKIECFSGKYCVCKGRLVISDNFSTWDEAKKWHDENIKEKDKQKKKAFVPPQLAHIRREDLDDIRNGADITGEDYLADYNFKGGEYGNWMTEKDKQVCLNMGYEAFYDLAKALGITNNDISLGGTLSIGFGSRGHGRAAAHYELERQVINLTKMKGAGSLAHEWGHALDHYLGEKLGYGKMLSEASCAKEYVDLFDAMEYRPATEEEKEKRYAMSIGNMTNEATKKLEVIAENFKNAMEIRKKAMSEEEKADIDGLVVHFNDTIKEVRESLDKKDYQPCMEKIDVLRNTVSAKAYYTTTDTDLHYIRSCISSAGYFTREKENYKVRSDYYLNSKEMDDITAKCDKGYWSSKCEMFARAFACYVQDKLKPGRSDFLCGHAECCVSMTRDENDNPKAVKAYPYGADRERINKAFDTFITQMKEKGLLTERAVPVQSKVL